VSVLGDRVAARRRHPSARSPVGAAVVAERIAAVLDATGAPWPEVGAAVLADRGVLGLTAAAYAEAMGVGEEVLGDAEAGRLALGELPAPLRRVVVARW